MTSEKLDKNCKLLILSDEKNQQENIHSRITHITHHVQQMMMMRNSRILANVSNYRSLARFFNA